MNELERIHKKIWAFRKEHGDKWLTPTPMDCVKYAITEMGEAIDNEIRLSRKNDLRRRKVEITPKDVVMEWTDMLIMVLSTTKKYFKTGMTGKVALSQIVYELAALVLLLEETPNNSSAIGLRCFSLAETIMCFIQKAGYNPEELVDEKLKIIYDKRIAEAK